MIPICLSKCILSTYLGYLPRHMKLVCLEINYAKTYLFGETLGSQPFFNCHKLNYTLLNETVNLAALESVQVFALVGKF